MTTNRPILLSYGMGVDSTAILLRWLVQPASRVLDGEPFDLSDLIVLTAQTGNEFPDTGRLVEDHVLPRLREAGVRFVEVGRVSSKQADGIAVLQDTRFPERIHLDGRFTLAQELEAAGTIPASGGTHLCSLKSKAQPLEAWIGHEMAGRPYRHAMGFNADETGRATRDVEARAKKGDLAQGYRIAFGFNADETRRVEKAIAAREQKGQVAASFPLIDWAWDYQDCRDFIRDVTGVEWPKSCCTFCPFAGGRKPILERYRAMPETASEALMLEKVALALNPRMKLYKTKTLEEIVEADGNQAALDGFAQALENVEWAVYRVRRMYSAPGRAVRDVKVVETGTQSDVEAYLRGMGPVKREAGLYRVIVRSRTEEVYPTQEEFYVAAPNRAAEKSGRKNFETLWADAQGTN